MPYQNALLSDLIGRIAQRFRVLVLFKTLKQVKQLTEEWLTIYNTQRPHDALKGLTPLMYKQKHSVSTL
ncbi:integrase core domain-containing protein [Pelistega indica]|uniref:integrase core domain-containing protein n=1 Tax=Pelistega indica TaxID=1414851 RepID=UPI0009DF089A